MNDNIKPTIGRNFLPEVYRELDLNGGDLAKVTEIDNLGRDEYINKAQWLNLCRYINQNRTYKADAVFFVENNPIIVFVHSIDASEEGLHEIFNRIWCMASPRLLFISTPAELNVYDLSNKPVRKEDRLEPLETVKKIADIAVILKKFRREAVESGEVFGDKRFEETDLRADKSLIQDIKTVRKRLFDQGLKDEKKIKYAHALIGRSIFIRYLEDREILTKDYFLEVAGDNPEWKKLLEQPSPRPAFCEGMKTPLYVNVLSDFDFTYRLYETLSKDFNGDMFPTDRYEKVAVKPEHLLSIKEFLQGAVEGQESLFFWAYRFDIIPIELISNIYEELYHFEDDLIKKKPGKQTKVERGTHYTPSSLVEFVLSRILTSERLKHRPQIMDPACGSGIFLVESFRRIVRHELHQTQSKTLAFSRLEEIIKNQIRGIDINQEAVRITAFSLYLAFLHYQEPPDILGQIKKGNKLPNLVYTPAKSKGKKYFNILAAANAFFIRDTVPDEDAGKNFSSNCADIVVGNPPWGKASEDEAGGRAVLEWCKERNKEISNKELSHAFLWLAADLLKQGGVAEFLISSSLFLRKSSKNSRARQDFIRAVYIREIVNFVQVRDVFFSGAISPFMAITFEKHPAPQDSYINYWTAGKKKIVQKTKAVVLDKSDFKYFHYGDAQHDDIWKIYYLGNHRDHSLISGLRLYSPLASFEKKGLKRRQGYKEGDRGRKDSGWLKEYRALPIRHFNRRYGPLDIESLLEPIPPMVSAKGIREIYEGMRILVLEGASAKDPEEKGQIISRFEKETFAYTRSLNCIKLESDNEEDYKVLLGILWSSLTRYYFFMTSSKWPIWHDQIYLMEIRALPIHFPRNAELKNKIIQIVDSLRNYDCRRLGEDPGIKKLEQELDDSIFELYALTEAERDLVRDRCTYDIKRVYDPAAVPVEPGSTTTGTLATLSAERLKQRGLEAYLYTFLRAWNNEIEDGKELRWQTVQHPGVPMIAVIFTLQDKGTSLPAGKDFKGWREVLSKLEDATRIPLSKRIYVEGIVRTVTREQIIIIKRNEERLWTRSAAHEDVEATLLQAMVNEKHRHA